MVCAPSRTGTAKREVVSSQTTTTTRGDKFGLETGPSGNLTITRLRKWRRLRASRRHHTVVAETGCREAGSRSQVSQQSMLCKLLLM